MSAIIIQLKSSALVIRTTVAGYKCNDGIRMS